MTYKEKYKEWLNELYGDIEVAGLTYSAAEILEAVDPIAFRVGFNDFIDYLYQNGEIKDTDISMYDIVKDEDMEVENGNFA